MHFLKGAILILVIAYMLNGLIGRRATAFLFGAIASIGAIVFVVALIYAFNH